MLYNIVKQIVQEGTAMSQKEKKKLVSIKTDDTLMETALHMLQVKEGSITSYQYRKKSKCHFNRNWIQ